MVYGGQNQARSVRTKYVVYGGQNQARNVRTKYVVYGGQNQTAHCFKSLLPIDAARPTFSSKISEMGVLPKSLTESRSDKVL